LINLKEGDIFTTIEGCEIIIVNRINSEKVYNALINYKVEITD